MGWIRVKALYYKRNCHLTSLNSLTNLETMNTICFLFKKSVFKLQMSTLIAGLTIFFRSYCPKYFT